MIKDHSNTSNGIRSVRNYISFYCYRCKEDFDVPEGDGSDDCHYDELSSGEKYIWARCPNSKNHKLVRYVTNQARDPYFIQSKKLGKERKIYRKELIQPGQDGFKTLYPKQWREIEEATERAHIKAEKEKQSRLEFYKKWRHTKEEDSMRAFLRAEGET